MKKELVRLLFSFIFLIIFSVKMVISIAPLIAIHLDSKIMNSVIMQLEIETNSSKAADQVKDSLNKGEYLIGSNKFNFEEPHQIMNSIQYVLLQYAHKELFYPRIPSPPPNC
ncbi:hypothetical protein [Daejeonella sp.]|uniref:hypothetical protein n=1 Tax=Daejeonella sp. TaxID=2805397 RepID=UPI003784CAE1